MNISSLAGRIQQHRLGLSIRSAAIAVGVSAATLLRAESGKTPDLETFGRICRWLGDDPGKYLGISSPINKSDHTYTTKDRVIGSDKVNALAEAILLAHKVQQLEEG